MSGESKLKEESVVSDVRGNTAYTYILRCSDGTLYTGWTYDLNRRLEMHNSGKGAKYTRSRLPVELIYYEAFLSKEAAMSREFAIKQLTRLKKLELIRGSGKMLVAGEEQKQDPDAE